MDLSKFVGIKIKSLREKHKMTQEDLAKVLDTTRQSISRYEQGQRKAGQDELFELSDYFNVSIGYFFPTTIDKTDIQDIYDQLHPPRQHKVLNYAENQLEEQNNGVEESSTIYLVGQTAAGEPLEYSQINAEQINTTVPRGADYALTVKGDSMEPLIKDGSIIFYKEQPTVENGEVAIVEIQGGEVTCKKFYFDGEKVILRSINDKYEDMIYEDGIRIIGKVIL